MAQLFHRRHHAPRTVSYTHLDVYKRQHLAMEIIADHGRMLSFEIVEVNPVIDEHNRTCLLYTSQQSTILQGRSC